MTLLKEIGQSPVLLKKEIDGFVLNRIQYAVLAEYWRLIAVSKLGLSNSHNYDAVTGAYGNLVIDENNH